MFCISIASLQGQHSVVKIIKDNNSYSLEVNGNPFFVKGVVGDTYLDKVRFYGGNSIRMGSRKEDVNIACDILRSDIKRERPWRA